MIILVCYEDPPAGTERKQNKSSISHWDRIDKSESRRCGRKTHDSIKYANQEGRQGSTEVTHHPVGVINSIHVNFCNKSNSRGRVWVSGATLHLQAVYSVLIIGLKEEEMAVRRQPGGIKSSLQACQRDSWPAMICGWSFAYSCWPNDHACPACQSHVFVVLQAPAHRAIAFAFLALFQLLQQTKIAWNSHWNRTREKVIL